MTNIRSCNRGLHSYVIAGSRSKCKRCGAVQVDPTDQRAGVAVDPARVFGARRRTLFSLKPEEPGPQAGFGKARHRR